jgi:murein DD-endopeptidase MepM/ murein hydrolase activator NlpD
MSGIIPSGYWRRALVIAVILMVAGGLVYGYRYYIQGSPPAKVPRIPAASLPKVAPLAPGFFELRARAEAEALKSEVVIKPGESLGKALENAGLGRRNHQQEILDCLTGGDDPIEVVRPGARLRIYWAGQDHAEVARLKFFPDSGGAPWQVIPKAGGGFRRYNLASRPLSLSAAGEGTVDHSLWNAGIKAGLDGTLILAMADLLASEIDFVTDIKKGDSFQVLYSRDYRDGQPQGAPIIDLVRMTNNGKEYEYYRYINAKGEAGYYNNDGQSSVKTFFMTPLQYKRISSGFTMSRRHPIYKVVRPHQGVDYAAPSGTPVSAVAAGKVVFADWNGGFGRLVTIQHNATYTTMYGHLSSFASGIKAGTLVQQGDLIGRVGATGTATGPHLDFRLKKNGVFIDPLPELARQIGQKLEGADFVAFARIVPGLQKRLNAQLARPKPAADPAEYKEELELGGDEAAENDGSNRSFDL